MPEPSLGELASAGQSQQAIPEVAVNSGAEMVRGLNQQAQFAAENTWRKYRSKLEQINNTFNNLAEVQKEEVMNEDRPELQKDAANIYKMILDNPGAFAGADPQKYTEIQAALGQITAKATQSKQDNFFDKENRKFVATNNELNSDENKGIIDNFRGQPLGSRKAYTLNLPPVFDVDAYTKGILESPSVKTDYANSEVTPDNQFIIETTGTKYNRDNFLSHWMGGLNMKTDKYGHSIRGYVQDQYNKLPDEVKKNIPGANDGEKMQNFWKKQGEKMFGSEGDIISDKKDHRTANTNYKEDEKLAQGEKRLEETIRHNKAMEGLGWSKFEFDSREDADAASGVVQEITDVISNATRPENLKAVLDPKGHRQQWGTISDPNLLKKYTTIDKDGKTTNTPDDILIDPTSGQLNIVYYKKNKKGQAETQEMEKGGKTKGAPYTVIDRIVPVSGSTWVSDVVGRNENAKNKGTINKNVQDFYKNIGGVFHGTRKLLNAEKGAAPAKQNKSVDLNTLDPNGFKKEGNNYRYKDGTLFDASGNIIKE